MLCLKRITESGMRFLGIVRLTSEQKKRLDQMNKDYEETFGQRGGKKDAVPSPGYARVNLSPSQRPPRSPIISPGRIASRLNPKEYGPAPVPTTKSTSLDSTASPRAVEPKSFTETAPCFWAMPKICSRLDFTNCCLLISGISLILGEITIPSGL